MPSQDAEQDPSLRWRLVRKTTVPIHDVYDHRRETKTQCPRRGTRVWIHNSQRRSSSRWMGLQIPRNQHNGPLPLVINPLRYTTDQNLQPFNRTRHASRPSTSVSTQLPSQDRCLGDEHGPPLEPREAQRQQMGDARERRPQR